jgi:hypothetical protein
MRYNNLDGKCFNGINLIIRTEQHSTSHCFRRNHGNFFIKRFIFNSSSIELNSNTRTHCISMILIIKYICLILSPEIFVLLLTFTEKLSLTNKFNIKRVLR